MPNEPAAGAPIDFGGAYANDLLTSFFELRSGDVGAALQLERPVRREELANALVAYARALGAPEAVVQNARRLRHPEARAVVTGQQVGLLLGPTYSLSKAVTAVTLAKRLDTPERPVIPVFWLATQDHDVAEIDHAHLLDADEALHRVSVQLPEGVPAGRLPVTADMVTSVEAALRGLSPQPPFLGEVLDLVRSAADGSGYGDWFAKLLLRFLGSEGLVLVDPLRPDFAALTSGVIERELLQPEESSHLINDAGRHLKERGYHPQLGRGEGATNLFLEVDEGGAPRRELLRFQDGRFLAGERRYDAPELLARLADDPTVITPAAGLRPITQDAALPTAVFVLGPGELRYVSQLGGVYRLHGVPMPLAWQRASVTVIEPSTRRLLETFGLDAAAFVSGHDDELRRVLLARAGHGHDFERAAATLGAELGALLAAVEQIDPTLEGAVLRGGRTLERTLGRLRELSAAALARRDETVTRQFRRLDAHLLPLGTPAERLLSPFSHALKFGIDPLVEGFLRLEPSGAQELFI